MTFRIRVVILMNLERDWEGIAGNYMKTCWLNGACQAVPGLRPDAGGGKNSGSF